MGTAAILFAIAALGGAVMAAMRLGGRELPPTALAVVHGLIAAAGLITLIILAAKGAAVGTLVFVAIAGFVIAALGGLALFFLFHLKKKVLSIPLMFVHATVAVISFALLLTAIFTR